MRVDTLDCCPAPNLYSIPESNLPSLNEPLPCRLAWMSEVCAPGYGAIGSAATVCQMCPKDTNSTGGTAAKPKPKCAACSPGWYTTVPGATACILGKSLLACNKCTCVRACVGAPFQRTMNTHSTTPRLTKHVIVC